VIVIWVPALAAGAVNPPLLAIVPAVAVQVTAELLVPVTVAVNCCCADALNTEVLGLTAMRICEDGDDDGVAWLAPFTLQAGATSRSLPINIRTAIRWKTAASPFCESKKLGDTLCKAKIFHLERTGRRTSRILERKCIEVEAQAEDHVGPRCPVRRTYTCERGLMITRIVTVEVIPLKQNLLRQSDARPRLQFRLSCISNDAEKAIDTVAM
jgi:hypothetical protein